MENKIKHFDLQGLAYYTQQLHDEILTHVENNSMCKDAQNFYEAEYHKKFKWSYSTIVSISPSSVTIKPKTDVDKEVTYIATFSAKRVYSHPTEEGSIVDDITNPQVIRVENVTGWTLVEGTVNKYTKTITYSEGINWKDDTVSISGSVVCIEQKEGSEEPEEELKYPVGSASASIKVQRDNFVFNEYSAIDSSIFNANYKTATNWTTGVGKSFDSVEGKPLIFCSSSSTHTFIQGGYSIIRNKYSIETNIGTYWCYVTGNSSGEPCNNLTIT